MKTTQIMKAIEKFQEEAKVIKATGTEIEYRQALKKVARAEESLSVELEREFWG